MAQQVERTHLSERPVFEIRSAKRQRAGVKPMGFWYGVGTDWLEFSVSWRPVPLHGVTIAVKDVLRLASVRDVIDFDATYGVDLRFGDRGDHVDTERAIDWPRVAKLCAGIEVYPYLRTEVPEELEWYLAFDVASGCVWDASVIKVLDAW